MGLEKDLGQVGALVGDFGFSVDEQCAVFDECEKLTPLTAADMAVFQVGTTHSGRFCERTKKLGFGSTGKDP